MMITAPITDNKHPMMPIGPIFSFKNIEPKMALQWNLIQYYILIIDEALPCNDT